LHDVGKVDLGANGQVNSTGDPHEHQSDRTDGHKGCLAQHQLQVANVMELGAMNENSATTAMRINKGTCRLIAGPQIWRRMLKPYSVSTHHLL
jgi:hypothetical protein